MHLFPWTTSAPHSGPGAPPIPSCDTSHPCRVLQIEALMMEMQNPDTGVKTQTQRVMITNIPHAVAGKIFVKGRGQESLSKEIPMWTPWPPQGARVPKNICCTSFETHLLPLSHSRLSHFAPASESEPQRLIITCFQLSYESLSRVTLLSLSTEVSKCFSLQICHSSSEAGSQIKINIKIQLTQAAWSQTERQYFRN